MPTYEYACRACGHEFEQFQSITAEPVRVCPSCRRRKVERKIGIGGAVIFKGGGFYETDYRSESWKKGEEASKEASKDASKEGTTDGTKVAGTEKSPSDTKKEPVQSVAAASPSDEKADATASAPPRASATKESKALSPRKSHAREGRGIGNVLQIGRASARKKGKTK